ncbi:2'-5' RNA ligase [Methyloglobulus morosus KoM1]|uniref:RNA 2',3'-cyclic phosphodiesterase n=1 Tax=Methyloglobulus morosus KoM1 TaxID=1116472 RepID=V5BKY4_9GAMM|nr:RNA 2',3'-cyclic phosphodiesterase [Methyloglobulus morosus]ESS66802.1 2'-5' RNA ligase [Methyloglobulus morosus KoM1]
MKRLFFAIWPDECTRQQCVKIANAVVPEQAHSVQAANIHVTLLFLGNIDPDKEERFKQALAAVQAPRMTLCFDKLSFWKKPGILCLTTTNPSPEIESFVEVLSKLARGLGIPIDERPFKPHVTLAKKVKNQVSLGFDPIIWHSSSFSLVESCQVSSGIVYRTVGEWKANKA